MKKFSNILLIKNKTNCLVIELILTYLVQHLYVYECKNKTIDLVSFAKVLNKYKILYKTEFVNVAKVFKETLKSNCLLITQNSFID